VNLVGASEFPIVFKRDRKNNIKIKENGNFSTKSILVFGVTLKLMTIDT